MNLTKMIDNLDFDTWIEGNDQGAMLAATDGHRGTHHQSFIGVVQQENTIHST